jgi:hypothetical protein
VQHFNIAQDFDDSFWSVDDKNKMLEVLMPYNLIAICTGHQHLPVGLLPGRIPMVNMMDSVVIGAWTREPGYIPELRPGGALVTDFALVRVAAPASGEGISMDVLYGTLEPSPSKPLQWMRGWNLTKTANQQLYVAKFKVSCLQGGPQPMVLSCTDTSYVMCERYCLP